MRFSIFLKFRLTSFGGRRRRRSKINETTALPKGRNMLLCPGQLLAMAESEVFLTRLLMDHEWSLVKETQPEYAITLKIKGTILQAKKIA
jgi:hypothetical protein